MKYSLTILTLLISAFLYSQGTFSRFEVFQFNLGDEFQYHESRGIGASSYNSSQHSQRVIGVLYNSDSTTVEYTWFVETMDSWLDNNYNWSTSFYTDTVTTVIDRLDLTLVEYDTLFIPYIDTSGFGGSSTPFSQVEHWACDSIVQGYYHSTSSFEGLHYTFAYGLGLGCVSSDFIDGTNPSYYGNYYHYWGMTGFVKDGDTCGYVVSTALEVQEYPTISIVVFPNPSSDFIEVKGAPENSDFRIFSISGQLLTSGVLSADQKRISVANFGDGLFILQVQYGDVVWIEKFRVEN